MPAQTATQIQASVGRVASGTRPAQQVTRVEVEQLQKVTKALPEGSALLIVLENVLEALLNGDDVTFLLTQKDLSTEEAAKLLQVSRPHVTKLMTNGALGFHMVGSHRRCTMADIEDYLRRREAATADVARAIGSPERVRREFMDLVPLSAEAEAELAELGFGESTK